jgi:hypothetical protein
VDEVREVTMATDRKPFRELVGEAPMATETVSLVGMLSRSREDEKFILTLGDGRSLALEIDAVKDYAVLGGTIGQVVVRIEIDSSRLPQDTSSLVGALKDNKKLPEKEQSVVDPLEGFVSGQMLVPFALATPHQVAAMQLAAMYAAPHRGSTLPWLVAWGGDPAIYRKA